MQGLSWSQRYEEKSVISLTLKGKETAEQGRSLGKQLTTLQCMRCHKSDPQNGNTEKGVTKFSPEGFPEEAMTELVLKGEQFSKQNQRAFKTKVMNEPDFSSSPSLEKKY